MCPEDANSQKRVRLELRTREVVLRWCKMPASGNSRPQNSQRRTKKMRAAWKTCDQSEEEKKVRRSMKARES